MNPRDLPEVVAELIIEMHEVRSELQAVNGQLNRLGNQIDQLKKTVDEGLKAICEEARQNTDRLIEACGRSMEPLISRVLDHKGRLKNLENPA